MNPVPEINPDARLTRRQLAAALSERGYQTAEATLASMVSRGGGPPFSKFSQRVLYRWGDALSWAEGKMSAPVRSTAELKAQAAQAAQAAA